MKYRVEGSPNIIDWDVVHDEPTVQTIFDARCHDRATAQAIVDALNVVEDFNNAKKA